MDVDNFSVIADEFDQRIKKIVWCTFTTIDTQNRPRSRMLHPIWEGSTGWVATGRQSFKAKHLAHSSFVSLTYWDPDHKQVYAECHAQWQDDQATKQHVWDLLRTTPGPLGYDPTMFWPNSEDESYGVIKLTPWRIELSSLAEMANPKVWRQSIAR